MSEMTDDMRAKILIAEDDAIVALDLQGMIMRLGYDVVAMVDNGQAAVAAVRRFQPDIVLLDMLLSGTMDGIDVAREIHTSLDVPVIFCVSSPDLAVLVRAKEVAYAGYLLKPINPDSLSTTLDTVLYKYKLEKRVKFAEEKFRALADKCEMMECFFEEGAAFSWKILPGKAIELKGYITQDGIGSPVLAERLESAASSRFLSGNGARASGNRLSVLLDLPGTDGNPVSFAAIGVKDPETGQISGIVVPLERGSL